MPISTKHPSEKIDPGITNQIKRFAEIKKEKKKIKRYVSDLNREERAIGKAVLDYLKQEQWEQLSVKDIGTVSPNTIFTCYVLAGKRKEAIKWLKDHGHSEIIIVRPNEKKLPGVIKQILKDPDEVVPDYFIWGETTKLGFRSK